jgi:ABC-type uncharacterized transport system YnjBCD ATPase subunit
MAKQPPNEVRLADPDEVVAIGNPESKPRRALTFHLPSGGRTRRQAKAAARLRKIATNPSYSDDPAEQKLSRGQQKRADYKRRLLRQAAKEPKKIDSR